MSERKPVILIVDDNHKNIQVAGNILRQEIDCNLSFALGGVQALAQAKKIQPDLILLDVMMPDLDGIETCKRLKAAPPLNGIPIIFLSAKSDEDDIVRGFEVGAEDYVTKPFRPAELIARVRTHLALKQKSDKIIQINNEQKELLHILCHDLINVLFPIQQTIPLLPFPIEREQLREKMKHLVGNGLNMIELVRKMRVLDEGKLHVMRVPLARAVHDSLLIVEEKLKGKHLELAIDVSDSHYIMAEPISLVNSVLLNLLTNAIKFSDKGGQISIQTTEDERFVCFTLSDQGVGMPPTMVEHVFDFSRSHSLPGTMGERGTGFGLPLVKKFLEKYGAEVEIQSRWSEVLPRESGTTITIHFLKGV